MDRRQAYTVNTSGFVGRCSRGTREESGKTICGRHDGQISWSISAEGPGGGW